MSDEAMALERILLRSWELDGYLGQTRVRIPREMGWPEIDVVAYNCERRSLRLGEVKARYGADRVLVLDGSVATALEQGGGIADEYLQSWVNFTDAVCALYPSDEPRLPGLPRWPDLHEAEVVFIVNGWELPGSDAKRALAEGIRRSIVQRWGYRIANPPKLGHLKVTVETTLDLLVRTITQVRTAIRDNRGARFGDPFLDGVREMIRYLEPSLSHVPWSADGKVGSKKQPFEAQVQVEAMTRLSAALGLAGVVPKAK